MEGRISDMIHTERELFLLKDELDAEALVIRKYMDYKQSIDDVELSVIVDNMINQHKKHYEMLLNHIKVC